jgi:hypothetical protein
VNDKKQCDPASDPSPAAPQLRDMLEDDAGVKRFCAAVKIDSLDVMFASKFNDAVRIIKQRAAQRK